MGKRKGKYKTIIGMRSNIPDELLEKQKRRRHRRDARSNRRRAKRSGGSIINRIDYAEG